MTPEQLELLQRHAPLLRLDPLERWAPVAVDGFLAAATVVHGSTVAGGPPATIDGRAPSGQHLDPVRGIRPAGRAHGMLRACGPAPAVDGWRCYGEVAKLGDDGLALRYWCFYPDNPFGLRIQDVGRHVGDWELVQVELDRAGAIAAVTVFQHGSPQRVAVGSDKLTIEDGRPHVFVAEGSHAAYLTAGSQPRWLKRDNTSADGPSEIPVVLAMPGDDDGWVAWSGRWGPDTGPVLPAWVLWLGRRLVRSGIGGESPAGPKGRSRPPKSTDPEATRAAGKRSVVARAVMPLLRFLGKATWPRELAVERVEVVGGAGAVGAGGAANASGTGASSAGSAGAGAGSASGAGSAAGAIRVRVSAGGRGPRRIRYVDVVVADARGVVTGWQREPVERGNTVDVEVVPLTAPGPGADPDTAPGAPAKVHVAGYNWLDQRSEVAPADVPPANGSGWAAFAFTATR